MLLEDSLVQKDRAFHRSRNKIPKHIDLTEPHATVISSNFARILTTGYPLVRSGF